MKKAILVSLLLAGCGGGGSDPEPIAAAPVDAGGTGVVTPAPAPNPAPSPITVTCTTFLDTTTCREPGQRQEGVAVVGVVPPVPAPSPVPVPSPAPSPQPTLTPVQAPAPPDSSRRAPSPVAPDPVVQPPVPANTVDGEIVLAALRAGVSQGPFASPYSGGDRPVRAADGGTYYLDQQMASYTVVTASWGRPVVYHGVSVQPNESDGLIGSVVGNGLSLGGFSLDLRTVDPVLDTVAGTWRNGDWLVDLIVQSDPDPALIRVCWNAFLPAPASIGGPPGSDPVHREFPFRRLTCVLTGRYAVSRDVGGRVVDDYGGSVYTFDGRW